VKTLLLRRLAAFAPTLLGASVLCFALLAVAPGDPAELLMRQSGGEATPEALADFRRQMDLDAPLPLRYLRWLADAARLDFGTSYATGEPVAALVLGRLPATLTLAAAAFALVLCVAIPVGVGAALQRNRPLDHVSRLWAILSLSVPSYWLALLLLYLFALELRWVAVAGGDGLPALVLPALTLGLGMAAFSSRLVRERTLEVLAQDHVRLAHAKGLTVAQVVRRHVLRNALLPLVTLWGMSFGYLLGGSVIVETVFSWPGVGQLAVEAIRTRDYPVLQCYVVVTTGFFMASSLIVDLAYLRLEPRLRGHFGRA
jgi:peptide/nickel transport system permease protein